MFHLTYHYAVPLLFNLSNFREYLKWKYGKSQPPFKPPLGWAPKYIDPLGPTLPYVICYYIKKAIWLIDNQLSKLV